VDLQLVHLFAPVTLLALARVVVDQLAVVADTVQ
jgi:hypothetical protein